MSLHRRADRLLGLARAAVPFAAGLIAWRDPRTGRYATIREFGYTGDVSQFLLTDFVRYDPGFTAVTNARERTLFWADVPGYSRSTTAREVLLPSGFKEGTTIVLERSGAASGLVHLSLGTSRVPDHARTFVGALREDLTELVSDAQAEVRVSAGGALDDLTHRELDVLRLVAGGLTNQQIAHRLGISGSTVSTHLERIHTKLDVTNRVAAAMVAVRRGLIE